VGEGKPPAHKASSDLIIKFNPCRTPHHVHITSLNPKLNPKASSDLIINFIFCHIIIIDQAGRRACNGQTGSVERLRPSE